MVSKAFKKTQPTWGRFSSMVCQWCVASAVTMESLWIVQNEICTGSLTGCCWLGQANLISYQRPHPLRPAGSTVIIAFQANYDTPTFNDRSAVDLPNVYSLC